MTTPASTHENITDSNESERLKQHQENLEYKLFFTVEEYFQKNLIDIPEQRENFQKIMNGNAPALSDLNAEMVVFLRKKFAKETTLPFWTESLNKVLSEENLKNNIHMALFERKIQEQQLENRCKSWFDMRSINSTQQLHFKKIIDTLTKADLVRATSSPTNFKAVFAEKDFDPSLNLQTLFVPQDVTTFLAELLWITTDVDALALFHDADFQDAVHVFVHTGYFSPAEFDKILMLTTVSPEERKNIIAKFLPTVNYVDAKKYQLFSDAELKILETDIYEKMAQEFTKQSWSALSRDVQLRLEAVFDDFAKLIEYPTENLDSTKIENALLTNTDFRAHITEIFQEKNNAYQAHLEAEKEQISSLDEMKDFLIKKLSPQQKMQIGGDSGIRAMHVGEFIKQEILGDTKKGFWKIENDNGKEIVIQEYSVQSIGTTDFEWKESGRFYAFRYGDFAEKIMERLQNPAARITVQSDTDTINTFDLLNAIEWHDVLSSIDTMDAENTKKWFDVGMTFSVHVDYPAPHREMVTVRNIDQTTKIISLELFSGQIVDVSFVDFMQTLALEEMKPRRVGDISSMENFAKNLEIIKNDKNQPIKGVEVKNGQFVMPDPINPDIRHPLWGFQGDKNFIQVETNASGEITATLIEYKTKQEREKEENDGDNLKYDEENIKKIKNEAKREKLKNEAKQLTKSAHTFKNISYTHLLQLIQATNATKPAIKKDITKGDGKNKEMTPTEAFEERHKVENGGYMSYGKPGFSLLTIGDLKFRFEHIVNAYKEKWNHKKEVRSAYAFINMNSLTGGGGVPAMARLINGTKDAWNERFKGKAMREHISSYVLKGNPKPHEILAGMMITIEMAGHLYPDTGLSDLQDNTYKWFNKVCLAIGVNPRSAFQQCFNKVVGNDEESRHHPPEEKLIERLFKMHQDNPMVQAIGGGAPFWKAADNTKRSQTEKGAAEANDIPNGQDRISYAYAKMNSNEFEITLGAIPKIFDAELTGPDTYWPFFVLATSNATNYVSPQTLAGFNSFAWQGHSFHAIGFCKNKSNSEVYRKTVAIAIREKFGADSDIYKQYSTIQSLVEKTGYRHNENVFKDLSNFWKKYYKELHPVLQLTDPALIVAMENNSLSTDERMAVEKYLSIFNIPGEKDFMIKGIRSYNAFNNTTYNTYAAENNFIYFQNPNEKNFRSIALQLDALEFDVHEKSISGASTATVLQNQIINYFAYLRDNETFRKNRDYQKKQFTLVYTELMNKLVQKTMPMDKAEYEAKKNGTKLKHFSMLENQLNFDCSYEHMTKKLTDPKFNYADDVTDEFFDKFLASGGGSANFYTSILRDQIRKQASDLAFTAGDNDEKYRVHP